MRQATDFLRRPGRFKRTGDARAVGRRFDLHEPHRFPNGPVSVRCRPHWDVLRVWQETERVFPATGRDPPSGVGIDT